MKEKVKNLLVEIKNKKPLVHQITNYVTVNDCANITLAIGGSPIMADDIEEVAEITSISNALVINIGTLNVRTINSMLLAGQIANGKKIPVVLDPVGAGASNLRNETTIKLLKEVKFAVIRGNASEIGFILGVSNATKGVDVSEKDKNLDKIEVAKQVATKYNCVVVITGAIDVITDGNQVIQCENGNESMGNITGTGCMLTALIGVCCGATSNHLCGAVAGVLYMGIAGENADKTNGTGSYRVNIIDTISKLTENDIEKYGRIK
ncbi:MAG: hydroxyethylthiazole kinase [Rickettsiales bacterium]|jgi:hydroxyethylthiazole kinase|nr:hydroxyethylthiazole kinase [Rickettsiales bacterium]